MDNYQAAENESAQPIGTRLAKLAMPYLQLNPSTATYQITVAEQVQMPLIPTAYKSNLNNEVQQMVWTQGN
jgi:hypothetical protein